MVMTKNILIVIMLSCILGFANFLANPNKPILGLAADEISFEMYANINESHILVDARSDEAFSKGHLEGAMNLSEEKFDTQLGKFLDKWNTDFKVYVYCSSESCGSSRAIAERLRNDCGIKNIFVIKGDWRKWKK